MLVSNIGHMANVSNFRRSGNPCLFAFSMPGPGRDGPPDSRTGLLSLKMGVVRTGVAFFDLDKTIIAKSSTLAFARPLHKAGLLRRRTLLRAATAQVIYRMAGADQEKLDKLRDQLVSLTKGMEASRIRELVEETIDEVVAPLVYEEALDLMDEHRRAGREVVIMSISPEEVARPLAAHLGVDHVIATRSTVDAEGCYAGELAFYASGTAKADAIRRLAEEWQVDLDRCYAYSDSATDLPMLEAVGHPVAVNPDRALRAVAAERSWPVAEFDSPVTLRTRFQTLPRPGAPLVSGTVLATAIAGAVTLWAWKSRQRVMTGARLKG